MPTDNQGKRFEQDVAWLFQSAGFRVEQNVDLGGQEFDIIATKREFGELHIRIAVECKFRTKGSVANSQVQDFVRAYEANAKVYGLTHGLLVSNRGFARFANAAAQAHTQVRLTTMATLEHELLGARTYVEATRRDYRSHFKRYIELHATQVYGQDAAVDVDDIAQLCCARLSSQEPSFTVLLGDFGSGKTTVAEQVHSRLADQLLNDGYRLFPVILYLRTLELHDSEDNFIEAHLKLSSKDFTLDRLKAMERRYRLAFILDGFDEVAANASEDDRLRLFSRAMRVAARGHSVLITSRPSYFANFGELQTLVSTLVERDFASVHNLSGQILRRDRPAHERLERQRQLVLDKLNAGSFPTFAASATAMYIIKPLEKSDIIRFLEPHAAVIKKHHKKTPQQVYDFLIGIYDLSDLLTRPLLLDMFVELLIANAFQLGGPDVEVGPAGLYHLYIEYHLARDWEKRRFLQRDERLAFARAMAVAMLESGGSLEATYSTVWEIVQKDKDAIKPERRHLLESDRDGVITDVRVCSFINVTAAGRIEFSHKSFMEYFVAEFIVHQLKLKKPITLLSKFLNYEILYFLGSYALMRAETRLEIVQHVTHVAHGQSQVYRSNLQIALMFSERSSQEREFSNIDYSRLRIAKKEYSSCIFKAVRFRHATVIETQFYGCLFEPFHIEGEIHDLSLEECNGTLLLPPNCEGIVMRRCRLDLGNTTTSAISVRGAEWEETVIRSHGTLALQSPRLNSVSISVAAGRTLSASSGEISSSAIGCIEAVHSWTKLPKLDLDGARLTNVALRFMAVSRNQYVKNEQALARCYGILVVDDPDRTLLMFRTRDHDGVERYAGWAQTDKLFLVGAEFYDRLDEPIVSKLADPLADHSGSHFSPATVRKVLSAASKAIRERELLEQARLAESLSTRPPKPRN